MTPRVSKYLIRRCVHCSQIMALVVIGVGVPVSMVFQCLVPEVQDHTPPKCKWYKWLINPRFYLVRKKMLDFQSISI